MRKFSKKFMAILTSLALLLTVFGSALSITALADEITYSKSFTLSEPYLVTDADGDSTTVTFGGPEGHIGMAVSPAVTNDGRLFGTDYYYGYSWTDESYAIVNESEKGTSGEVVYYSSNPISDIRFDTVYATDDSFWLAKPLEFYASSDGKTYEKIETTRTLAGHTFTNPNFAGVNSKIYDTYTFAESDKIRYVKVVSTVNSANDDYAAAVNRIFGIEYNSYETNITYSGNFALNNPYSVANANGDSTTVEYKSATEGNIQGAVDGSIYDGKRIFDGGAYYCGYSWTAESYTFVNAAGKGTSGEVVYYSSDPISDIRFDTIYSANDDFWLAKPLEFYASSDGKTYKKIETTRTLAGHNFINPNFAGVNSQIYDTYTFPEGAKIRYIKVVSTINSADNDFAVTLNRIFGIEYNKYDTNIKYHNNFTLNNPYSVTDANGDSSAVTYGGPEGVISQAVNPGVADDGRIYGTDYYYGYGWTAESYTIVNSAGKGTSGEVVYYSADVIKDVRFDTLYSPDDNFWLAKPLEFFASSDGINYEKIETTRILAGHTFTNPNFAGVNSKVYDKYTFPEGDNIHYVKVVSTINSADNDFAAGMNRIYGIEYNNYIDWSEITAGDANDDNEVNIRDIVHLKKSIADATGSVAVNNFYAADINRDDELNALDLTKLRKIILGK